MVMVVNSAAAAKAMAANSASRSGLQKQVLALYKRALRAAQQKDRELALAQREASGTTTTAAETAETNVGVSDNSTYVYVRERFRDDATSVRRVDFNVIEHLLRKGERDLKMLARMKGAHFAHVPRSSAS